MKKPVWRAGWSSCAVTIPARLASTPPRGTLRAGAAHRGHSACQPGRSTVPGSGALGAVDPGVSTTAETANIPITLFRNAFLLVSSHSSEFCVENTVPIPALSAWARRDSKLTGSLGSRQRSGRNTEELLAGCPAAPSFTRWGVQPPTRCMVAGTEGLILCVSVAGPPQPDIWSSASLDVAEKTCF